jgi:hypothetical protein
VNLGAVVEPEFNFHVGKIASAFVFEFDVAELKIGYGVAVPSNFDSAEFGSGSSNREMRVPRSNPTRDDLGSKVHGGSI